jgi:7,8-dihydropterin-6-yl-methyl-4-(beta-D-ribofuranosyl)aminobenzene 5'-phosphate synthase
VKRGAEMKLTILYDSEAEQGLMKGWGFSCLLELESENVLFDTGWDGRMLLFNMKKLGKNPKQIKKIVISHSHWDHMGGLPYLLREGVEVYVPQSFSKHLKEEIASRSDLREMTGAQKICEEVWTTGELGERTKEQSLIVKTGGGLVVVVGCAHPGLGKIFKIASRFGKIAGVVGGMHGFRDYALLKGLSLIMPSHCTANKGKIAELFPEACVVGRAGLKITWNSRCNLLSL